MPIIQTILTFFETQGGQSYLGEPVTQLEHALQTAVAAKRHKASSLQVSAALLHDIGHFLHAFPENCADMDINSAHEKLGEAYLRRYFHPTVAELVKHHVNAKRYLVATDREYQKCLSSASMKSLQLQGGPMSLDEINVFKAHPLLQEILLLRHWDDGAKIPNKSLPALSEFIPDLTVSLR